MLFPAETKNPIPYEGHMGVADIIKFIAELGVNSKHLIHETGLLFITIELMHITEGNSLYSLTFIVERLIC